MGLDPNSLPDSVLRLMRKEDRPRGNAGLTFAEAEAKRDGREEKEIQDTIETDLLRRGVLCCRPRMDRKSTIRKGWPDVTFSYRGRFVGLEVKTARGKLSPDQVECLYALRKFPSLAVVGVVRSLPEVLAVLEILDAEPAAPLAVFPASFRDLPA